MGLKALAQKATAIGFKAAGDLKEKCVYTSVFSDGVNSDSETDYAVEALFPEYSMFEKSTNSNIQPGDVQGLIELAKLGATPSPGDRVTRADGRVFTLVSYSSNVALYRLQLRIA